MVEIELKNNQTGYNAIGEYIRRYWEHHIEDAVIVSMEISRDRKVYEHRNEVACPYNWNSIEYLNDWWESEKYIKLFGIKSIDELDVSGGIYTED